MSPKCAVTNFQERAAGEWGPQLISHGGQRHCIQSRSPGWPEGKCSLLACLVVLSGHLLRKTPGVGRIIILCVEREEGWLAGLQMSLRLYWRGGSCLVASAQAALGSLPLRPSFLLCTQSTAVMVIVQPRWLSVLCASLL